MLFALYEKHNGNILAMTRDNECFIRGKNQLYFYRDLYQFSEALGKIREKRAKEVSSFLRDAKILALDQAVRLLEPRQTALRGKDGLPLLDSENQPIFVTMEPSYKEIRTAWEIIKTELGEPTSVSKQDATFLNRFIVPSAEARLTAKRAIEDFLT